MLLPHRGCQKLPESSQHHNRWANAPHNTLGNALRHAVQTPKKSSTHKTFHSWFYVTAERLQQGVSLVLSGRSLVLWFGRPKHNRKAQCTNAISNWPFCRSQMAPLRREMPSAAWAELVGRGDGIALCVDSNIALGQRFGQWNPFRVAPDHTEFPRRL